MTGKDILRAAAELNLADDLIVWPATYALIKGEGFVRTGYAVIWALFLASGENLQAYQDAHGILDEHCNGDIKAHASRLDRYERRQLLLELANAQ